ncbi:MAG: hypothetical protein M1823_004978 [Watsoniomyces obsoletus]|nr:MAG: hypothetical protein M1823_004978 [Watsoniomyces obsoletus]
MRSRHRRHRLPLIFLALLSFASAAPPATKPDAIKAVGQAVESVKSVLVSAVGPSTTKDVAQASASAAASAKNKVDAGTKVAPVDGKDGKPHAGPWVGVAGDREKTTTTTSKTEDSKKNDKAVSSGGHKPAPRPLTETEIPKVNDGVMDDPNRETPKKGTTGTEGGVSEKDRDRKAQEGQTGEKTEKKPDPPKEARPLPHSEEQKIREKGGIKEDVMEGSGEQGSDGKSKDTEEVELPGGLAKPVDLPPKPHDEPPPPPPSSSKTDPLNPIKPDTDPDDIPSTTVPGGGTNGLIQPLHSLFLALTMILFSEIGDKTFLIAALMAMKHPRLVVFSAAFSALIAMTILSAMLGHAVPTLIPKRYTNILAALLFLVFGAKMLLEGYKMHPEDSPSEEMKEVEMELEERAHLARSRKYTTVSGGKHHHRSDPYSLESGVGIGGRRSSNTNTPRKSRGLTRILSPPQSPSESSSAGSPSPSRSPSPTSLSSRSRARATLPSRNTVRNILAGLNNLLSFLLSPAWVQTFVMTFLGEWGDRSQIATIAMAAGQDYWWVTAGAVTGHGICTAAAVIGGRAVAGRVSLRVVTLGGALTFLAFGLIYLVEGLYYTV